jgi:hypothetical protein
MSLSGYRDANVRLTALNEKLERATAEVRASAKAIQQILHGSPGQEMSRTHR